MLIAAVVLGLIAVFFARTFLSASDSTEGQVAVRTVPAVVAVEAFQFGEKITPEKLKVVQWPADGVPVGSFQRVADAVGDEGTRVAMRAIDPNELLTAKSISGKDSRLSASQLLGPDMRAVSVPIGEASGAAGFVFPGDRVDVYLTRPADGDNLPYADQLMQNVRVLAVGQDMNVGRDKPDVTKTATLEVTPLQAQRIALAQSVGTISLSLRNIQDESRVPLQTAQILDLNDGTVTRILRKPESIRRDEPVRAVSAGPATGPVLPAGPSIEVLRGTKPTVYTVPAGK